MVRVEGSDSDFSGTMYLATKVSSCSTIYYKTGGPVFVSRLPCVLCCVSLRAILRPPLSRKEKGIFAKACTRRPVTDHVLNIGTENISSLGECHGFSNLNESGKDSIKNWTPLLLFSFSSFIF